MAKAGINPELFYYDSLCERKGLEAGTVRGHVSTEDGKSIGSPVVIAEKAITFKAVAESDT